MLLRYNKAKHGTILKVEFYLYTTENASVNETFDEQQRQETNITHMAADKGNIKAQINASTLYAIYPRRLACVCKTGAS